jgi:hypothetical protein
MFMIETGSGGEPPQTKRITRTACTTPKLCAAQQHWLFLPTHFVNRGKTLSLMYSRPPAWVKLHFELSASTRGITAIIELFVASKSIGAPQASSPVY